MGLRTFAAVVAVQGATTMRSRAKPASKSRKHKVSKKGRATVAKNKKRPATVAKKSGRSAKPGEARIVDRRVDPHASDIQMMRRIKDEL
jgi:hypothetical protein